MDEIRKDDYGIYHAIEICDDPNQNAKNQINRNKALNKFYFNDDTGFENWMLDRYCSKYDDFLGVCLCGKSLKNIYIVFRKVNDTIVKCYIGSSCIERYSFHLTDDLKKLNRTTYDCEVCNKRVKKDNLKHGKCEDCDKEIDCGKGYKRCYGCKIKKQNSFYDICKKCNERIDTYHGKCEDCNKSINCLYEKCYSCKTNLLQKECLKCKTKIEEKYTFCFRCFRGSDSD